MWIMVFLSWSLSIDLFSLDLLAFAKNLFIRGSDNDNKISGEEAGFEPFRRSRLSRSSFLDVLMTRVRQVELGMVLQASKSLSANAGSAHQLDRL